MLQNSAIPMPNKNLEQKKSYINSYETFLQKQLSESLCIFGILVHLYF